MNDDNTDGPLDPVSLPITATPPASLEEDVVASLYQRGLLRIKTRGMPLVLRYSLAAAACAAMLAIGILIGRQGASGPTITGAETDLYALLLFETEGYEEPHGTGLLESYSQYSRWVAAAMARGQFIDGHDLDVSRGWLLEPGTSTVGNAASVGGAPLSGVFFIRANDPQHALELAKQLPHLTDGGQVLVQKTIPTANPPQVNADASAG